MRKTPHWLADFHNKGKKDTRTFERLFDEPKEEVKNCHCKDGNICRRCQNAEDKYYEED